MKSKRFVALASAAALCAAMLGGCGSSSTTATAGSTAAGSTAAGSTASGGQGGQDRRL